MQQEIEAKGKKKSSIAGIWNFLAQKENN